MLNNKHLCFFWREKMKLIKIALASVLLTACGSDREYREVRVEEKKPKIIKKCWDEYRYPPGVDCRYYPRECFRLRQTIRVCENRRI